MSKAWKNWCRLCAKDDGYKISLKDNKEGSDLSMRISKYLSLQIKDDDFPSCICEVCSSVISDFNLFAVKCEKVQNFFESIILSNKQNDCEENYKSLRNDYLLPSSLEEKKFFVGGILYKDEIKINEVNGLPINVSSGKNKRRIKTKEPNGDVGKIKSTTELPIKDEALSDSNLDDRDTDIFPGAGHESDSDEDYNIPLANVTDNSIKKSIKRKKKPKTSAKIKKKREGKKEKEKKSVESLEEDVNIKAEPLSDAENLNEDLNVLNGVERKLKKEKKSNPLSFLKYDCHICGEDAKNWNALCIHFGDVHNARAKIMCCCGKYLASRVSIGRHSAKHGKATNSFECSKCSKRFPRESELRTHMISHLPKEEYPFVCCKCARRFTTQQLLRHHEKKHVPMEERLVHPCEICQSKFASKSSLMMHMKAVHERLKPFVCDQCGRAFTTKGILEEHQVRHSDARPHVCNVCHKSFKTKQRLAIHSDTHNDTVYQCPFCPIRLNSRRTLRMHLFVHDDVCRYKCNFCDKAFKRAKDLKNHSNLHTGRRPYSCPWCSRTFANGSNCRAHKRRMHPNELRISDASAALVNKVPVPQTEESEEKLSVESGPPKIIYTTVKRKVPAPAVVKPNFVFQSDASDKESKMDCTNEVSPKKDKNETKPEKSSPVHNSYESSMSPLNLNTTATNKQGEGNAELTITPIIQNENAINDFQSVTENYNAVLQGRSLDQTYTSGDFKDNSEIIFNKNTQIYTNFYNAATGQFVPANPYGIHFVRDDGN